MNKQQYLTTSDNKSWSFFKQNVGFVCYIEFPIHLLSLLILLIFWIILLKWGQWKALFELICAYCYENVGHSNISLTMEWKIIKTSKKVYHYYVVLNIDVSCKFSCHRRYANINVTFLNAVSHRLSPPWIQLFQCRKTQKIRKGKLGRQSSASNLNLPLNTIQVMQSLRNNTRRHQLRAACQANIDVPNKRPRPTLLDNIWLD